MRLASAAEMKRTTLAPRQKLPREGTKLRALYDLLFASKGAVVDVTMKHFAGNAAGPYVNQLQDFYGLDIRHISNGSTITGRKSQWLLAGEWFGRVYVDYVAERLEPKQ